MAKPSVILFLGAGASACESFPTVLQFFEHIKFPDGMDARGYETACMELARRIALAERTQENVKWPRFDAEKLWGNLDLLVNSNRLTDQPFGLPVTRGVRIPPDAGRVSPEDLLTFLKQEILRIYGRRISLSSKPSPHREAFALLHDLLPPHEYLSVFTTNYDTIIEDVFRSSTSAHGIDGLGQLCTGFTNENPGRWKPELFDAKPSSGMRQVNLFKLHGSATWKWESNASDREPVEMNWRQPAGDSDCLLYFGYKSVPETEPFKTLHNRLKESLRGHSSVISVGFQFADPYIRETFDFALRANATLRITCCLRQAPAPTSALSALMEAFPGRVDLLLGSDQTPVAFGDERFSASLKTRLSDVFRNVI